MISNSLKGLTAHIPAGQFLRYLLIGGWNTLFGYGCFALFTALLDPVMRYGYVVASILANLVAITVSYLGYKWFVFKTKGNYLREWSRALLVYGGSMLISAAMLPVVVLLLRRTTSMTKAAPYVAGALIMGLSVIYTFLAHKNFSFRQPAKLAGPTMINVSECVICGTPIHTFGSGIVAPFLAQRIWNREAFPAQYLQCDQCDFGFFNPRLEPSEEARLYAGYRDAEYLRVRNSTEPWYTAELNNSFDDSKTMEARRRKLQDIFRKHLPAPGPSSVLDFGGDRGELIQSLFPDAQKYVYDISSVEPLPGIQSLSLDKCRGTHFDLIICSNVLEHVASPRQLLLQIDSIAKPGTLVFLEVPVESPHGLRTAAKRIAQETILLITRPSLGFSLLKFGTRNVMHEHLNFFSLKALELLGSSIDGWMKIASGQYPPFVSTASPTAWALLQWRGRSD